jgi:hypothetical protein
VGPVPSAEGHGRVAESAGRLEAEDGQAWVGSRQRRHVARDLAPSLKNSDGGARATRKKNINHSNQNPRLANARDQQKKTRNDRRRASTKSNRIKHRHQTSDRNEKRNNFEAK